MPLPVPLETRFLPAATGAAWHQLQSVLGDRLTSFVLTSPDRHSDPTGVAPCGGIAVHSSDIVDACEGFVRSFSEGLYALMATEWNLAENPYAIMHVFRGGLLIHEDPLGWQIDAHADDLHKGMDLEDPHFMLFVAGPELGHHAALLGQQVLKALPAKLHDLLDHAAEAEGHEDLCPLAWAPRPPA